MSKQQIEDLNKEAYKRAEEELRDEKVIVVKDFVLKTLRKIDETKKAKELIEEQLRILNKDLEDLRNGDFSKIEERINKSAVAKNISQVFINEINNYHTQKPFNGYFGGVVSTTTTTNNPRVTLSVIPQYTRADWNQITSGTYDTEYRVYYL